MCTQICVKYNDLISIQGIFGPQNDHKSQNTRRQVTIQWSPKGVQRAGELTHGVITFVRFVLAVA